MPTPHPKWPARPALLPLLLALSILLPRVTTAQGAARETDEEAGAEYELQGLFAVMSVVRVGQVHMFYRARLLSDRFNPGHETIEARLFTEEEIPWEEIAFRTVREALQHFFEDRRKGNFDRVHTVDIV